MRRLLMIGASVFLALALLLGYRLLRTPWIPPADFDILRIVWFLENLPLIIGWPLVVAFLAMSGLCFHRARRFRESDSVEDEERRLVGHLLADPLRPPPSEARSEP